MTVILTTSPSLTPLHQTRTTHKTGTGSPTPEIIQSVITGHCPICGFAIGATAGAIIGASTYVATTYIYHRTFSVDDYRTSVIVGSVGGALIGGGIGIGSPAISKPIIGAGIGVISGQIGYSITSGEKYNNDEMLIATAVGGTAGALTSGFSASTTGGLLTRAAIDGVAGASQYAFTENANGRMPDAQTALQTGINSSINSLLWDGAEYTGMKIPSRVVFFEDMVENVNVSQSLKSTYTDMMKKAWMTDAFNDAFRTSISYITGNSIK